MPFNLLEVFKPRDFISKNQSVESVVSLAFKVNKKTGTRVARAVLDNGITLIKEVTASGVEISQTIDLPKITSVVERNNVIRELYKTKHTQEQIAAMLDISQATVSSVLRKK